MTPWLLLMAVSAWAADPSVDPDPVDLRSTLWLGAAAEPVARRAPGVVTTAALQARITPRFGLESSLSLFARPDASFEYAPTNFGEATVIYGRSSNPTFAGEIRAQFGLMEHAITTRQGLWRLSWTADLGGGAIATRDLPYSQPRRPGQPAVASGDAPQLAIVQVHPTAVFGTTLGLSSTERMRVRATVLHRSWVENLGGLALRRLGSTMVGVDVGVRLGRRRQTAAKPGGTVPASGTKPALTR